MPFREYPSAIGISVRRESGEATVYESLLYVDQSGLDAEQQRQLGASDLSVSGIGGTQSFASAGTVTLSDSGQELQPETLAATNMTEDAKGGTNSIVQPLPTPGGKFIYVDKHHGNDALSGRATVVAGSAGPKKTIAAGLKIIESGDTLVIKSGNYGEDLNIAGRNISVVIDGNVDLSGLSGSMNVPPPSIPDSTNVGGVSTNSSGQ